MVPTIVRPSWRSAPKRPVTLRVVRVTDQADGGIRAPQRPAWSVLYGIALLTSGAVFAAEATLPGGLARTLTVLAAVLCGVMLFRLWIGCNRWQLVHEAKQATPAAIAERNEVSSMQEVA